MLCVEYYSVLLDWQPLQKPNNRHDEMSSEELLLTLVFYMEGRLYRTNIARPREASFLWGQDVYDGWGDDNVLSLMP